jgi:glycosyltransferase involved in cell wall biosynthesis
MMNEKHAFGKLAVVVDNGVLGDSRVQKIATSAKKSGWEVLLLGISPTSVRQEFDLEGVKVVLAPCPKYLSSFKRQNPGYSLRSFGGYARNIDYQRARIRMLGRKRDIEVCSASGKKTLSWAWKFFAFKFSRVSYGLRGIGYKKGVDHMVSRRGLIEKIKVLLILSIFRKRAWQYLEPLLIDLEAALYPELKNFSPDLIHANDFRVLPTVARFACSSGEEKSRIKFVWDAHEFLPGVHLVTQRAQIGTEMAEMQFGVTADACVTVSDELARLLVERHGLSSVPTVVLNAPVETSASPDLEETLRETLKLPAWTPLVVYSGAISERRGVIDVIEALTISKEFHFAVVCPQEPKFRKRILETAMKFGVADRVHIVDYVPFDQITKFISSADVGIIPLHHTLNHEVALITKYFEYLHAGLPLVVSDVKQMSETTQEFALGEVFESGNYKDLSFALESAFKNREAYILNAKRNVDLTEWTWEKQFEKLNSLYLKLLEK